MQLTKLIAFASALTFAAAVELEVEAEADSQMLAKELTDRMRAMGFDQVDSSDNEEKKIMRQCKNQFHGREKGSPKIARLNEDEVTEAAKYIFTGDEEALRAQFVTEAMALDEAGDNDGDIGWRDCVRAVKSVRLGVDEEWTIWPGNNSYANYEIQYEILYGDNTQLNDIARHLGFDTVQDDASDSDRQLIGQWANHIKIGDNLRAPKNDGRLDRDEVHKVFMSKLNSDYWADYLRDQVMNLDDDEDGLVTWKEVMQIARAKETGVNEPWTVWPLHVFIQLKRGMMDSVPLEGEHPQDGFRARINPNTGSVAIVGDVSGGAESDGKTDVDQLMGKVEEMGYSQGYFTATRSEREQIDEMVKEIVAENFNGSSLLDEPTFTDAYILAFGELSD